MPLEGAPVVSGVSGAAAANQLKVTAAGFRQATTRPFCRCKSCIQHACHKRRHLTLGLYVGQVLVWMYFSSGGIMFKWTKENNYLEHTLSTLSYPELIDI